MTITTPSIAIYHRLVALTILWIITTNLRSRGGKFILIRNSGPARPPLLGTCDRRVESPSVTSPGNCRLSRNALSMHIHQKQETHTPGKKEILT
ncbi:hypothetical protein L211DRAFT_103541 [Terfezia boudieri ATCC MYA-4762]|uniref:Uncharacterized protein n=1 Tax=Terfezia boudieri ATCC MYA-4762 TaxID=1051890 RepID=A0A3N4LQL5_9PEZI|nr:hypothetical protein L211DRAFT_103541 [Terfezia boudieri ATCC MYA-4762]